MLSLVLGLTSISCSKDDSKDENSQRELPRGEELVLEIQDKIVEYIKAHENPTAAEIQDMLAEYGDLVEGRIEDDVLYLRIDSTYDYICHPAEETINAGDFDDTEIEQLYAEIANDLYPDNTTRGTTRGLVARLLNKNKILLWNPWNFNDVQENISSLKREITTTNDWRDLKKIANYDIVIINTHGSEPNSSGFPVGTTELRGDSDGLLDYLREKGWSYGYGNRGGKPTYFLEYRHLEDLLPDDLSKTMVWTAMCFAGSDESEIKKAVQAKKALLFAGASYRININEFKPFFNNFIAEFDNGASVSSSIKKAFRIPDNKQFNQGQKAYLEYSRGIYSAWYYGSSNTRATSENVVIGNIDVHPMTSVDEKPRGSITLAYELADGGISSTNINAGFWIRNTETKESFEMPFSETTTELYQRYNHRTYISRLELLGNTEDFEPGTYEYKTYLEIDGEKEYSDETYEFTVDNRLEDVLPEEFRVLIEPYMPIHKGTNPPNVEGVYLNSPAVLVYSSDGGYDPGKVFADNYLRFQNQDMKNNTIDYEAKEVSKGSTLSTESGPGAFISGTGNDFTIFFNTTGIIYEDEYNVSYKEALLISGTLSDSGIRDFYSGFVMVEKSSDPKEYLIDIGTYRVFKDRDGLAAFANWPNNARARSFKVENGQVKTPWSMYDSGKSRYKSSVSK